MTGVEPIGCAGPSGCVRACAVRACAWVCVLVCPPFYATRRPSNMNNNAAPGASDNDCRVSGLWLCPYALLTHARRSAETVSRVPPRRRGRGVRGPPAPQPWSRLCDGPRRRLVPGIMSNEKWLTPTIRPTAPAWRIATRTSSPWLVVATRSYTSFLRGGPPRVYICLHRISFAFNNPRCLPWGPKCPRLALSTSNAFARCRRSIWYVCFLHLRWPNRRFGQLIMCLLYGSDTISFH